MNELRLIAQQFAKIIINISPLGNGLINDTFLVTTENTYFVLQRINPKVFRKPEQIMDNLIKINWHIRQKTNTALELKIPELLKTITNHAYYLDDQGDCWRALDYIEDSVSLDVLASVRQAEQTGFALGYFHRLVNNLDPLFLHDTLPGFHITPAYLSHYQHIIAQAPEQIDSQSLYCVNFISKFQHLASALETAKEKGLLPLRVIHGDPKLNNFLFDQYGKKIIGLIDLDTVKPGLVHYDIGDCLRSCCHKLDTNKFDLELCSAILKSYLSEVSPFFSEDDYQFLFAAIQLIPFELGLRFYTDYLEGNSYFKVTDPKENLRRAVNQFELCQNITEQEATINVLIDKIKIECKS